MKQAIYVRHAKSSWRQPALSDHQRPLNNRGEKDAPFMAQKLKLYKPDVDSLISSSATRAMQTATHFAHTYQKPVTSIIIEDDLYHASEESLSQYLFTLSDDVNSVMIFAHNPGLTYLANQYSNRPIDNVPTCGIFTLKSKSDLWTHFFDNVEVEFLIYPKLYNDEN